MTTRRDRPGGGDLSDPEAALVAARGAGVGLAHRLGQHVLVDREALEAIVHALAAGPGDDVLEIGPGLGTLTVELARRARRVVAVDLDAACVRATRSATAGVGSVTVVHGDALRAEPSGLGLPTGWLAAGNIPYGITGALLAHLLEREDPPARAVLMVQREVAERLAAPAGGWSLATLAVRSLARVERLRDVPPTSFLPAPAVWSSVLRLTPARSLEADERRAALQVARACFQMRRKVLRHGVTRACGGDQARGVRALAEAGIDARLRPGELDLDAWRRLGAAVEAETASAIPDPSP